MKCLCKRSLKSKHTFIEPIILEKNNYYECEFITYYEIIIQSNINYIFVTDNDNNKRIFHPDVFYERFYTLKEERKLKLQKLQK